MGGWEVQIPARLADATQSGIHWCKHRAGGKVAAILCAINLKKKRFTLQNKKPIAVFWQKTVKNETTSTWYSSRRVAEPYSGYKVLVEEDTDRILGAHILGSEAGEVINLFALAIRSGMRATDLKHMLFTYPTSGSNMTRML
jgi:Pyridine nucleotide-disulphide oxidoreductase, dimerisation domain